MTLAAVPTAGDVPTATAAQMAEADRIASTVLGIPLEALMENAAHQVAAATRAFAGQIAGKRVLALAGTGNNGGDALGALRHLRGWGAAVEALVAGPRERLRPLAGLQHDVLTRIGVRCGDASATGEEELAATLSRADVLLDGLLGYSARGAPRGTTAMLIGLANRSRKPIIAVDLPSGLDPDTGVAPGDAIRATVTVTLALPKPGLVAAAARPYVGDLLLADIGIPDRAFPQLGTTMAAPFEQGDLVRIVLPARG
jgi:NAD(P)H-hydrate epimerase